MSARDDFPILAKYADHEMPLGHEVKRALDVIDDLRAERDRFREGYRRLRIAQAMETDEEAEAHAAAVPDFT